MQPDTARDVLMPSPSRVNARRCLNFMRGGHTCMCPQIPPKSPSALLHRSQSPSPNVAVAPCTLAVLYRRSQADVASALMHQLGHDNAPTMAAAAAQGSQGTLCKVPQPVQDAAGCVVTDLEQYSASPRVEALGTAAGSRVGSTSEADPWSSLPPAMPLVEEVGIGTMCPCMLLSCHVPGGVITTCMAARCC